MAEPIRVHYIGEFASDALALAYLQARFWDVSSTGASNPWQGTLYRNTTTNRYRIWTGTVWELFMPRPITGVYFVDKSGNDATAEGSVMLPYLTIGAAYTAAPAGSTILVGPGVYAETLAIIKSINIGEQARGSVTIQNAVIGGAVITITPAAAGIVGRISPSIVNTSNVNQADMAIHVNNAGGAGACDVWFDGILISGGANGTGIEVDGGGIVRTGVKVSDTDTGIVGAIDLDLVTTNDWVQFKNCIFTGGNAIWMNIAGLAGQVIIANSMLAAAAAGEVLRFGEAAATGINLTIESSVIAGTLNLDNAAGTGIVILTAGTQINAINGVQHNNIIQKWLGEDEFTITLYTTPIDGAVVANMYTVPVTNRFNPHTVRILNRAANTAGATNVQVNGTAGASVVGAGAAAIVQGIRNCVVTQDSIVGGGVLAFETTVGGGGATHVDVAVTGKLS